MKIQGTPTEIHEKSREINEIDEKRQTRKSNNDHWEPDRPEIEKVNKRFKKKMIGFGRPDEIEKHVPAGDPLTPHQNMFQIKELSIKIDEITIRITAITIRIDEIK